MCVVNSLGSILLMIGRNILAFFGELFIPIKLILTNRRVAAQKIDSSDIEALPHNTLRDLIKDEWTRAKDLEEKLQRLTTALSVSVTVSGLVSSIMLQKLPSVYVKSVAGGLMFLATAYLLVGALIGFTGFIPKPRHGYGAKFLNNSRGRSAAAKKILVEAVTSFQCDNTIRANKAYAAAASIRNGVVAFALAFLVISLAWIADATYKDVKELTPIPLSRTSIKYPPSLFT